MHELAALFPSVEVVSVALLGTVFQHPLQELRLEVALGRAHLEAVEHKRKSALDQSLEHVAHGGCTVSLVLTISFLQACRHLLPVLEGFSLVKELHARQKPGHHFATFAFFLEHFFPSLDHASKLGLSVIFYDLSVAPTQVESDLGALEPVLDCTLLLHECNILF